MGYSTTRTDQLGHKNNKQLNFAEVTWRLSHNSVNNFGSNQLYPCLSGGYSRSLENLELTERSVKKFITPARTTTRTSTVREGDT